MKTTKSKIEEKIQEIRENSKQPNHFFKDKSDLQDFDWMIRELNNTKLVYRLIAFFTFSILAFILVSLFATHFGFLENRSRDPFSLFLMLLGTINLAAYYYQYRLKIERLKTGIFLLEIKGGLNEDV